MPAGQHHLRYAMEQRDGNMQLRIAHVFMELDAIVSNGAATGCKMTSRQLLLQTRNSTGKAKSIRELQPVFKYEERAIHIASGTSNMVQQLKTPAKETYWSAWLVSFWAGRRQISLWSLLTRNQDWLRQVKSCALFGSAQQLIAASAARQIVHTPEQRLVVQKEVDLLIKRHLREDLERHLKETDRDIEARKYLQIVLHCLELPD